MLYSFRNEMPKLPGARSVWHSVVIAWCTHLLQSGMEQLSKLVYYPTIVWWASACNKREIVVFMRNVVRVSKADKFNMASAKHPFFI